MRAIVKLANSGRVTVKYGLKVVSSVPGAGASEPCIAVPAPTATIDKEVVDLESLIKGLLEPDNGFSHRGRPHTEIGAFGGWPELAKKHNITSRLPSGCEAENRETARVPTPSATDHERSRFWDVALIAEKVNQAQQDGKGLSRHQNWFRRE
jgi:hypothetical protein